MRQLLLLLILLPTAALGDPIRVFASVIPIQTFVEKIGGEHVDARAMVRPGFNPHTYDPTPQQISALAGAALYVRTGVPFENAWMERIQSANPKMEVLDAREGIALGEMEAHDHDDHNEHRHDKHDEAHHDHGHDDHGKKDQHAHEEHAHNDHGHDEHAAHDDHDHGHQQDPHVWVDPKRVKQMAGRIRDKLGGMAQAHASDFARNHDAFVAELNTLDAELHARLDPLRNRKFMVFHPAWGYFADSYGLTQVSIEREGKEPGARGLAALIEQAKEDNIKVVFVQPQFDRRQASQIAQAIGGVVVPVDPLAPDYVDNLRRVGKLFAEALQQ
jgi:zinc transport system substrate-binding protein